MSEKSKINRRINNVANISTVIVSALFTFMGFAGLPTIHEYIKLFFEVDFKAVELVFNFLVFSLFVLVILHLVFRFGDKKAEADTAIVMLTHLVNRIDDELDKVPHGILAKVQTVSSIRNQYETLTTAIPANTDNEYKNAKKIYTERFKHKSKPRISASELFNKTVQKNVLKAIIHESESISEILETINEVGTNMFLGAGVIRNAVWDYLHGYSTTTPFDDVDVVYYNSKDKRKERDEEIERRLTKKMPNLVWSVKNQARMNVINNDAEYKNLFNAIEKWPETATAFAVSKRGDSDYDIIAPHGLGDLFRLLVKPTPAFEARKDDYRARIKSKKWRERWPHLQIH